MVYYRTEVIVPGDRYVSLQLPDGFPEGRAIVSVSVPEPHLAPIDEDVTDPDHQDIEWWEEFDQESDR